VFRIASGCGQSLGSFYALAPWLNHLAVISAGCRKIRVATVSSFSPVMMALQSFVVLIWYPKLRAFTLEDMQKKLARIDPKKQRAYLSGARLF